MTLLLLEVEQLDDIAALAEHLSPCVQHRGDPLAVAQGEIVLDHESGCMTAVEKLLPGKPVAGVNADLGARQRPLGAPTVQRGIVKPVDDVVLGDEAVDDLRLEIPVKGTDLPQRRDTAFLGRLPAGDDLDQKRRVVRISC